MPSYFDNAKEIIFWILCKFFNIKNHQKVIFLQKKVLDASRTEDSNKLFNIMNAAN